MLAYIKSVLGIALILNAGGIIHEHPEILNWWFVLATGLSFVGCSLLLDGHEESK